MTRLTWGASGLRYFETGVDRGVLYLPGKDGVPWNGLKSVAEAPSGGEPRPYYIDGIKYLNVASAEEFIATLEAFSSPPEFAICDGTLSLHNGLFVTQQPRSQFGLAYRTLVGNDIQGVDHGYKIHLVYNALAAPSQRSNQTVGTGVQPLSLSWQITTTPPRMTGVKPTAHFVIDSRLTPKRLMDAIEDILYGTVDDAARMPSVDELRALFDSEGPLIAVNRFTNPSFESQGAQFEIGRNIALNPLQAAAGVGLTTNNGASYVVTRGQALPVATPDGITTGAKIVSQAANTTRVLGSAYNVDALSATGPARSLGTWVHVNRAGYSAVLANGPTVVLPANTWTWVRSGAGGGAVSAHASIVITHDTDIPMSTDVAWVTGSTAHVGNDIPEEPIYGGMTYRDPAVSVVWAGTVGQSASIMRAYRATKVGPVSTSWAEAYRSRLWSNTGANSLCITPNGTSAVVANPAIGAFVDLAPDVAIDELFTVLVLVRKTGPTTLLPSLYGAVDIFDGVYRSLAQTPNEAGEFVVRFTFTRPNTATLQLRLVHGQPHNAAPDIFFDNLAIVPGDYKGEFFYGDLLDAGGRFYSWQGLPSQSYSELHSWY